MLLHRRVLLIVSFVIVVGSITATLGYGLHLRSATYRTNCEERLSNRLGMPLTIGAVRPLTVGSRQFNDVHLFLPNRNVEVFHCQRAVWNTETGEAGRKHRLFLAGGMLLAGTHEWGSSEYGLMLQSGLGHDFAALELGRVVFDDIDIVWSHPGFQFTAQGTTGQIVFDQLGEGRATLTADRLNEVATDGPIKIVAKFTPGDRLRFQEVVLSLPSVPLAVLGLDALLGSSLTRGDFEGSVTYRNSDESSAVSVSGSICAAQLAEFTTLVEGGPYDGTVELQVERALFGEAGLENVRLSGRVSGLQASQIAAALGGPSLDGTAQLQLHQAEYVRGKIKYLSAEGSATGLPLQALTDLIGKGRVTGRLAVTIHSLVIVDDRLVSAHVTLDAVPPADGPGTIDRSVMQAASIELLGIDATKLLPQRFERIEYARLGLTLTLNRGELRIGGTHGDDGDSILTVTLFGREYGIIKAPGATYHVEDPVALIRERLSKYHAEDIGDWLRKPRNKKDSAQPD